jgi:hypothetical protein
METAIIAIPNIRRFSPVFLADPTAGSSLKVDMDESDLQAG